jgi:hypothetical protein
MGIEASHVVGPLVGGAIGFASALFAEPLRRWLFRPKLFLDFRNAPEFQARTPEQWQGYPNGSAALVIGTRQAHYVRIRVQNVSNHVARICSAYLVNVERQDQRGEYSATDYSDTIPLSWSCREPKSFEPIDIPASAAFFFNVVSAREGSKELQVATSVMPLRYGSLLSTPGTYRFTVQVAGDEIVPVTLRVCARWSGEWDKLETWNGELEQANGAHAATEAGRATDAERAKVG